MTRPSTAGACSHLVTAAERRQKGGAPAGRPPSPRPATRAENASREIAAVATTEALEVERLIEVCYQIFRGLDSHRQSYQPVADPHRQPLLARNGPVACRR